MIESEKPHQRQGREAAEHEQIAVREVDELDDAVHHRVPKGDESNDHPVRQPDDQLLQENLRSRHAGYCSGGSRLRQSKADGEASESKSGSDLQAPLTRILVVAICPGHHLDDASTLCCDAVRWTGRPLTLILSPKRRGRGETPSPLPCKGEGQGEGSFRSVHRIKCVAALTS